jgi:hypothetical protein
VLPLRASAMGPLPGRFTDPDRLAEVDEWHAGVPYLLDHS